MLSGPAALPARASGPRTTAATASSDPRRSARRARAPLAVPDGRCGTRPPREWPATGRRRPIAAAADPRRRAPPRSCAATRAATKFVAARHAYRTIPARAVDPPVPRAPLLPRAGRGSLGRRRAAVRRHLAGAPPPTAGARPAKRGPPGPAPRRGRRPRGRALPPRRPDARDVAIGGRPAARPAPRPVRLRAALRRPRDGPRGDATRRLRARGPRAVRAVERGASARADARGAARGSLPAAPGDERQHQPRGRVGRGSVGDGGGMAARRDRGSADHGARGRRRRGASALDEHGRGGRGAGRPARRGRGAARCEPDHARGRASPLRDRAPLRRRPAARTGARGRSPRGPRS